MRIHPRDLPLRRNQLVKHLADPGAVLPARISPDSAPGLDALTQHLRTSEQYWVSAPMAALAMSAGAQLTELDAAVATRPSRCGLIYYEGGIGNLPLPTGSINVRADGTPQRVPIEHLPVAALSWGPFKDETLVWTFTDRRQLNEAIEPHGGKLVETGMPRLVPMMAITVPLIPTELDDINPAIPHAVTQALVASWLLLQQPALIVQSSLRPKKSTQGESTRLGMSAPEVSVVDLRRKYKPDGREENGEEGGSRARYRWVAAGTWRTYRHPRYSPERRAVQQWIPEYINGPRGAPLLMTEKVNVWRR